MLLRHLCYLLNASNTKNIATYTHTLCTAPKRGINLYEMWWKWFILIYIYILYVLFKKKYLIHPIS